MIQLNHVTYTYPDQPAPALADFSVTIQPGEFVLVVGPSGAGKSTFLRSLNGLVPHFYGGRWAGRAEVFGRDPVALAPRGMADLVGFVFQDPEAQFVVDTVEDELAFAMENFALAPATMRKRVEEVLDQMGIAHLRSRRISTLSGGEKQRVALASGARSRADVARHVEPLHREGETRTSIGGRRGAAPSQRGSGANHHPQRTSAGARRAVRRSRALFARIRRAAHTG